MYIKILRVPCSLRVLLPAQMWQRTQHQEITMMEAHLNLLDSSCGNRTRSNGSWGESSRRCSEDSTKSKSELHCFSLLQKWGREVVGEWLSSDVEEGQHNKNLRRR